MLFSSELVNGTLKSIILQALQCNPRMYGYELAQYVKKQADNRIPFNEGDLYPILCALELEGLVTTETENVGNRFRKFYQYHNIGSKILAGKRTATPCLLRFFYPCSSKNRKPFSNAVLAKTQVVLSLGVPLRVGLSTARPHCLAQLRAIRFHPSRNPSPESQFDLNTHFLFH